MKVGAHPLLVAVALGLLGPSALPSADDAGPARATPRTAPCDGCTCGAAERSDDAAEDEVFDLACLDQGADGAADELVLVLSEVPEFPV